MNADKAEIAIGRRIETAHEGLRQKLFRLGTAGEFHVGAAHTMLQDIRILDQYLLPADYEVPAPYLRELPDLIESTQEQDALCARLWTECQGEAGLSSYEAERSRLESLLLEFRFSPRAYERAVRLREHTLLRDAVPVLHRERSKPQDLEVAEQRLRLTIDAIGVLDQELTDDLRRLDEARAELASRNEQLALEIAHSQRRCDQQTIANALFGLRKATEGFDYRRGYSFAEYAQHWIRMAIKMNWIKRK